jgi:anti-sigma factor RsiW
MDHRPYENWLLDDERLTAEQERNLRAHLRNCPECASLDRANMALRAAPVSVPAAGFAARFEARLAAERKVQRRRNIFGWTLLLLIGMGVLLVLVAPYSAYFSSPVQFATILASSLINFGLTLRAASLIGNTLFDVFASFIPPSVWAFSFTLFGGVGFLWVFSFRKFGRIPQTAS